MSDENARNLVESKFSRLIPFEAATLDVYGQCLSQIRLH